MQYSGYKHHKHGSLPREEVRDGASKLLLPYTILGRKLEVCTT